jgi:hypothetical protein
MRRSEEARVSEEAVRRKGGEGGPRKLGMSYGETEEPVWSAEESESGRKGARRSEKAKVPEEGGLTRSSRVKNLWTPVYILTRNHKHQAREVAASAGEYMEV